MAEKKYSIVKLQILAKEANPQSVGSVLGPKGINIMKFCKEFNELTSSFDKSTVVPVELSIAPNKKFSFVIKSPPVSYLIKKALGIDKGVANPGHSLSYKISQAEIKKIALIKMKELTAYPDDLNAICNIIKGSAISMGVEVENE